MPVIDGTTIDGSLDATTNTILASFLTSAPTYVRVSSIHGDKSEYQNTTIYIM